MFMRKAICLLCLLLFGGCLAARADSLVTVTVNYVYHNYDDTGSTTFSFDPDQVFFYLQPFYEGDFLYPLVQAPDFPDGGTSFDTVDFFGGSLAFTNFARILSTILKSTVPARTFRLPPALGQCPPS
jgi:hypothetical protein